MRAVILIVCAAMLSACAAHQPFQDHVSRFQTETNRVRIEFGFPGMTAAYVLSDGTVGTAASGLACLACLAGISGLSVNQRV